MASTASAIYDSLPLRNDRLSTRVLTIHPGTGDEDIRCSLRVMCLNANPKYEALSYTWGDTADRREVYVNGQNMMVTKNLEEALRALRLPRTRRRLWADAVCINQNDIREKEQQVREMGQVYRNASRVLTWLGPKNPWYPWYDPFTDALTDVLGRKWWKRVWIIQEIALAASEPLVVCGDCSIPWSRMVAHARSYTYHTIHQLRAIRADTLCPPRLRHLEVTNDITPRLEDPLYIWLARTANFEATQPLDKVYAILHLARSQLQTRVRIDYSTNANGLMQELMHWSIEKQQNLDLLALCHPDRSVQLNSWTPDMTVDGLAPLPSTIKNISSSRVRESLYMKPDGYWLACAQTIHKRSQVIDNENDRSALRFCWLIASENILRARGILLGRVVGDPCGDHERVKTCEYHDRVHFEFDKLWDACSERELSRKAKDAVVMPVDDLRYLREVETYKARLRAEEVISNASEDLLLEMLASGMGYPDSDSSVSQRLPELHGERHDFWI